MAGFGKSERAVLKALYESGGATRLMLTEKTLLSVVSVSSLLAGLLKRGLAKSEGEEKKPMGRPSALYRISPDFGYTLGVSLDADAVRIATLSAGKEALFDTAQTVRFPALQRPEEILDQVERIIDVHLENCSLPQKRIRAIGFAVPGVVNSREGVWQEGLRIPGVHDLSIGERFQKRYSLPVTVQDTARSITFFEKECGVAKRFENFALLHAGIGVGAGVVIGKRLFEGVHGFSGEIGHLRMSLDDFPCRCGKRGCLETIISEGGIVRRLSERVAGVSSLTDIVGKARSGEREILRFLSEIGEHIGRACSLLAALFDPEAVIVSGSCSILSPYLEESARACLLREAVPSMADKVELVFSDYGYNQEAIGAALLAYERFWEGFIT